MAILRVLTKGFFLIAIVCGVFSVINFILPVSNDSVIENNGSVLLEADDLPKIEDKLKKERLTDFSAFKKRNIFDTEFMSLGFAARSYDPLTVEKRDDAFSNRYRLAGILMDDNPQAVFEESGSGQAIVCGINDEVGEAQVKEILPGRVILEKKEKVFEMEIKASDQQRKNVFK